MKTLHGRDVEKYRDSCCKTFIFGTVENVIWCITQQHTLYQRFEGLIETRGW